MAEVEELGEAVRLTLILDLARDAHVVEAAGPGAESFFDRVQAVQVFH
jgi:hypothetical protein